MTYAFDGHLVYGRRHKKWGDGQEGCPLCRPRPFSYTRDPEHGAIYVTLRRGARMIPRTEDGAFRTRWFWERVPHRHGPNILRLWPSGHLDVLICRRCGLDHFSGGFPPWGWATESQENMRALTEYVDRYYR